MGSLPEAGHAHSHHGHGTGLPWLDILVAVSAVFISVVSLAVSIEHGKTMERMVDQNAKLVAASTIPVLTYNWAKYDPATGKPLVRMIVSNGGVGPALIDRFEVRYKGRLFQHPAALLHACCEAALPAGSTSEKIPGVFMSNVTGFILPAHEILEPLRIMPENAPGLDKAFDSVKGDVSFHACYCSVLNECWETEFNHSRPRPVKSCEVGPKDILW